MIQCCSASPIQQGTVINFILQDCFLIFGTFEKYIAQNCRPLASNMNHPDIKFKKFSYPGYLRNISQETVLYLVEILFCAKMYCQSTWPPFPSCCQKHCSCIWPDETVTHTTVGTNRCSKASRIKLSLHVAWVGGLSDLWSRSKPLAEHAVIAHLFHSYRLCFLVFDHIRNVMFTRSTVPGVIYLHVWTNTTLSRLLIFVTGMTLMSKHFSLVFVLTE